MLVIIHALLFSRTGYTEDLARSWAARNGFTTDRVDVLDEEIRIAQEPSPGDVMQRAFATFPVEDGVRMAVSLPKAGAGRPRVGGGRGLPRSGHLPADPAVTVYARIFAVARASNPALADWMSRHEAELLDVIRDASAPEPLPPPPAEVADPPTVPFPSAFRLYTGTLASALAREFLNAGGSRTELPDAKKIAREVRVWRLDIPVVLEGIPSPFTLPVRLSEAPNADGKGQQLRATLLSTSDGGPGSLFPRTREDRIRLGAEVVLDANTHRLLVSTLRWVRAREGAEAPDITLTETDSVWVRKSALERVDGTARNITIGTQVRVSATRADHLQAGYTYRPWLGGTQDATATLRAGMTGTVRQAASGNSVAQRTAKRLIGTSDAVVVELDNVLVTTLALAPTSGQAPDAILDKPPLGSLESVPLPEGWSGRQDVAVWSSCQRPYARAARWVFWQEHGPGRASVAERWRDADGVEQFQVELGGVAEPAATWEAARDRVVGYMRSGS